MRFLIDTKIDDLELYKFEFF